MFGKYISIAVLAVVGSLALSGSALGAQFKAESAPVNYIGTVPVATPLTFSTTAGTASCQTTGFGGTNNASSSTAEMPITFGAGSCKNFGEAFKSIVSNKCEFKLAIGTVISEGTVEVVCVTKPIEIQKENCTVSIGSQKPLGNVNFSNSTANGHRIFEATFEIKTGLNYTVTGAGCGTKEGLVTTGGITGTARIAGEEPKKSVLQDVWVE